MIKAILERVKDNQDSLISFVSFRGALTTYSYHTLLKKITHYAKALRSFLTYRSADIESVVLCVDDPETLFLLSWAVMWMGKRLVLIPSSSSDITPLVGALHEQLKKPLFIFDEDAQGGIDDGFMTSPEALLSDLDTFEFSENAICHADEEGAITFFSSGSQGRMKPISLTYNQILSVVNTVKDRYRVVSSDRVLNPCPLTHVGAFKYGFLGFLVGCSQWHVHPQFVVTHPRRFLRVLDEQQITITWGPLSLCDVLCTAMLSSIEDLSLVSLRLWVCAGESIVWTAFEAFQEALLRFGMAHKGLCAAYGLTELSSGVTYSLPNNGRCLTIEGRSYVSCGKAIKGLSLKVLDEEGQAVQDGQEGLLYVKGETLFKGYGVLYDALDCSDFELGWFCTGDTGFLFEDEWFPSGRKNGGFHSNGNTFDVDDVTHVLEASSGFSYSDVFVILDPQRSQFSAAAVCLVRDEPLEANLKNELNERFYQQFGAIPRFCLSAKRSDLPLTSLGKVAESQLWEWALKQGVSECAPIADKAGISQLQAVFQEVLCHPCDIATPLFELGLNSLFIPRIQDKIEGGFQQKVSVIDILSSATIADLAQRLTPHSQMLPTPGTSEKTFSLGEDQAIAVIGMEVALPGAADLTTFWANILIGEPQLDRLSTEALLKRGESQALIDNPHYVPVCYSIPELLGFDSQFFGYSDGEAMGIDPQQRRLLELGWLLLRGSGYPSGPEQSVGVFVSTGINVYMNDHRLFPNLQGQFMGPLTQGASDFSASRLSYKLNLKGPSFAVQTACSSSLVAVHQAVQSLRSGDCEMAIAGGVSYWNISEVGYLYQEGSIVSPDGQCQPFSSSANGTVFSNGGGLVLLKSLAKAREDGDTIWAVINGSSVNNDGQCKPGFSVPSAQSQAAVISQAVHRSGFDTGMIGYVELHGTGTPMGDPLEIDGLKQAMRQCPGHFSACAIGSVKRVTGHLGVASGIVGLIKTVLSLAHGQIPPSPYLSDWNSESDISDAGIYAPKEPVPWPSDSPLAGVSSFGLGGTNAHVILSSSPEGVFATKAAQEIKDTTPFKRKVLRFSEKDPVEETLPLQVSQWGPVLDDEREPISGDIMLISCQAPGRCHQHVSHLLAAKNRSFCDFRTGTPDSLNGSQIVVVLEEADLDLEVFLSFLKWSHRYSSDLTITVVLPDLETVSTAVVGDLAATIGLIHSFRLESPRHRFFVVEGEGQSLTDLGCFKEASCWHVRLKNGDYYSRQLMTVTSEDKSSSLLASKKRYLVLGGTGRVGRVLCRHLVETYDAELVIVGRRSYEEVMSVLETIAVSDRVTYMTLDMTKESSFQSLIDCLVGTPVNGVFHLGMVHEKRAIQDLEMGDIRAHLGIKLIGAVSLWHYIRTQKGIDFVCFFSSGISLLPDMGVHRGAYLAATYAYDALINRFLMEGSTPVKLLHWGYWESALQLDRSLDIPSGISLDMLSDQDALALFDQAMALPLPNIAILPQPKRSVTVTEAASPVAIVTLQALVSDLLKRPLQVLDRQKPFSELGVDSLLALDLVFSINQQLTPEPPLRVQDIYRYGTISALESYFKLDVRSVDEATVVEETVDRMAIVGMACRFPGASSIQAYHQLLEQGQCAVNPISQTRFHNWVHSYGLDSSKVYGGFLSDFPSVDYAFFNLSPKDARVMDVRHGLFLEESYHALEDAGYSPLLLKDKRVSVFSGVEQSSVAFESEPFVGAGRLTGLSNSVLASRLAYHLDLDGPAIAVDTACSSSLVAIHQAILSLKQGDCDMAVAGGVSFLGSGYQHKLLQEAQLLSPSGRCASFDSASDGIVPSEGVGVVVLKPLSKAREDNDRIYGVILSSKVNQDGHSNGLSAPNVDRQISLLKDMYSEIDPATISYIETHGTGTAIGDPIECDALASIKGFEDCAFGSVKPNVGHLLSASGMAGLIKLLLSLHHKRLFKTIHHDQLNPDIRLRKSSLFIQTDHVDWKGVQGCCRGAISNFGMSGTNVHMVLEEADSYLSSSPVSGQGVLIPLSAKSGESLLSYRLRLAAFLAEDPLISVQDIAYTLMRRDGFYAHRCLFYVTSLEDLHACLKTGTISNLDVTMVPVEQTSVMKAYLESNLEHWDLTGHSGRLCSLPGYCFMAPLNEVKEGGGLVILGES